MTKFLIPGS